MAELTYRPLNQADGSAQWSFGGYKVLAAVNALLEVSKRDELPDEAVLEVVVRAATGVAGIRERHFEYLIHKTLRQIIRLQDHPRSLIQVILQVMELPETDTTASRPPQSASCIELLPPLLNAAVLSLLSTTVPLSKTLTSVVVALDSRNTILVRPSASESQKARSTHVLAFSSHRELLLVESEGAFDIDIWETVAETAKALCCGASPEIGDAMAVEGQEPDRGLEGHIRALVTAEIMSC